MHCASHPSEPPPTHTHSLISANDATSSHDLMARAQTQGPGCYPWVWRCTLADSHPHSPPLQQHTLSFSSYLTSPLSSLVPPSFQFWTPTLNFFFVCGEIPFSLALSSGNSSKICFFPVPEEAEQFR